MGNELEDGVQHGRRVVVGAEDVDNPGLDGRYGAEMTSTGLAAQYVWCAHVDGQARFMCAPRGIHGRWKFADVYAKRGPLLDAGRASPAQNEEQDHSPTEQRSGLQCRSDRTGTKENHISGKMICTMSDIPFTMPIKPAPETRQG